MARLAPSACRPVTGSWSGRGTGHQSARSLTSCGPIPTTRGRSWRPTSGPPTTSPASTPLTGSRSCPSGGRRRRVRWRCAPVLSRSTWPRAAGDASPCPGRGGSPGGSRGPSPDGSWASRSTAPARSESRSGTRPGPGAGSTTAASASRARTTEGSAPPDARCTWASANRHPDRTSPTSPCGSGAHRPGPRHGAEHRRA